MKKVAVASNNKHKIEEIRAILSGIYGDAIEVKSLSDIGFSGDIVEDGDTFEENAEIKARAAAKLGYIAIADDSGLCVDALDGAPGGYSARVAGEPGDDKKNNDKLLDTLRHLRDLGNSVLVVEHDEDTMRAADFIVDVGPGAGIHGGEIVAAGTLDDIIAEPRSIPLRWLCS